jgi:hypothetical protein
MGELIYLSTERRERRPYQPNPQQPHYDNLARRPQSVPAITREQIQENMRLYHITILSKIKERRNKEIQERIETRRRDRLAKEALEKSQLLMANQERQAAQNSKLAAEYRRIESTLRRKQLMMDLKIGFIDLPMAYGVLIGESLSSYYQTTKQSRAGRYLSRNFGSLLQKAAILTPPVYIAAKHFGF